MSKVSLAAAEQHWGRATVSSNFSVPLKKGIIWLIKLIAIKKVYGRETTRDSLTDFQKSWRFSIRKVFVLCVYTDYSGDSDPICVIIFAKHYKE